MSQFFINRPKFAWVVALFISLAGLLAIPALPVAQYPSVAPPQISIGATYPGASAQVLVDSVTSVIEEELNGARDLLYFESTSNSNGSAEVTVTFQPGTDPQLAQVDVQNRLKKAEARLPQAVLTQGVQVEQASAGFLLIYALNYKPGAEHADTTALGDYAARHINNELRRVPGVGKLQFFSSEAAMRVWVDPQKLVGYGLSIDDVGSAIRGQNVQVPAGAFGSSPGSTEQELTATLAVKGTLDDPQAFGRIVLRANADGSRVTLADVARIEVGSENYNFAARLNGKPAVAGAIQLAPGANAIQTAEAVRQRLAELSVNFPDDVEYAVPYDTSRFVDVAIEKVIHTLLEAMVLVFLVMFLFLQNVRYTLIPSIVVPVCLLGTLAIMYGLGFSVNMMTMFGMVLAIGILVDDAIVVVENVERIMAEEGLPPVAATVKAMQQVSGAIVGITLVLAAVFLPLAFMGGSVGVIYQQFSLSLAVSILFSGFLALTFTPALCATLLKPIEGGHHQKRGFFGAFNRFFTALTERYTLLNHRLVRRAGRFMLVYLGLVAVLGYSYVRLPEAFVPAEDLGYNIVDVQLPPGATRARTDATAQQLEAFLQSREATANSFLVMGFSFSGQGDNAALAFPTFKDWSQRGPEQSAGAETAAVNARFAAPEDGSVMAVMPPPIDGLGNSGGFALRLQDRAGLGREALLAARDQLLGEANGNPKILYAMMEGLAEAPQLRLDIDREKARAHGVSFEAINSTLSTAFGSAVINDFSNSGRQQRVVVQAEQGARMTPESVLRLFVPNDRSEQVPLATFVTPRWEEGPVQIVRYNGYPSIRIAGDAMYGVSSGEAMAEMERLASRLPEGIGYQWTGLSYQEQVASGQATQLFALAILVVFLLLVALYESWSIPFTVMLIVPIGALGAVLAVIVAGLANDVYFKVGLITIIGLAAKNAILIVEFAKELWEQGRSLGEAAIEAARLRFRPIVMTSLAFILGVVPLTLATGAGAASQRAIGTGVIGGMLGATLLGVVFVPVCFVWVLSLLRSRPAPVAQPVPAQE
ncbi:multidrug efflux RND transporter permease subunit [Pseudomonas otitidis]|uniref:efflux RND transporter permease subunit n=1 Tax=Metapseudomonas otitidis TaxID=319939 RepID=UPI00244C955A|nr:efflux RND transporter permease subunit [Pseudomonas otitidis]MDH1105866.1 multidrug efflux RND transporter permease subunit [Pseudomonas otitidis]MDH1157013.1 multidrug efflux RND transporter permease subunit [Pseudomonas otitidis]MDH1162317.1 multidrug efflux RND transporter permease subunit [Pseudomonas otitidis]